MFATRLGRVLALLAFGGSLALPALAGPVTFDFEDQPFGGDTPLSITQDSLTATFMSPGDPGAFGITSAFGLYPEMTGNILLSPGSAFVDSVPLTISFSEAISSITFQFGLGGTAPGAMIQLLTDAGGSALATGTVPIGSLLPQGLLTFTGAAFRQIALSSNTLDFGIDNLTVSAAVTPVPEPAPMAMIALGLAWLSAKRRRAGKSRQGSAA